MSATRDPNDLDWRLVTKYLRCKLSGESSGRGLPKKIQDWLRDLATTHRGRLLGSCLAIDLTADALTPQEVTALLGFMDESKDDPCVRLARVLREHPNHAFWICASRLACEEPREENHTYVRVLELSRFIRYYLKPSTGRSSRPDQAEEVLRQYVQDQDGRDLSDITVSWSGPTSRVWVLPKEDYDDLLRLADKKHPGTVFQEALGLSYLDGAGSGGWPHFIGVIYPTTRPGGWSARQPTALDANWTNSPALYVSHTREDGWGRTQNCRLKTYTRQTGGFVRERVHPGFDGLTAEFRAADIGLADPMSETCQEAIAKAAMKRFVSCGAAATVSRRRRPNKVE